MGRLPRYRKFYAGLVKELVTFAEYDFRNSVKVGDGSTKGQHESSAALQWEKLGQPQIVKTISAPHFPEELAYLWEWYRSHAMGIAISGMAPAVVTWESVVAWCDLMGIRVEPWEARAMVTIGYIRAVVEGESIQKAAKHNHATFGSDRSHREKNGDRRSQRHPVI